MIKGLLAVGVLLIIFAAKASYTGRVIAVFLAMGMLFFAYKNKNKF